MVGIGLIGTIPRKNEPRCEKISELASSIVNRGAPFLVGKGGPWRSKLDGKVGFRGAVVRIWV
jgi:hypothetical protein